MTRVDLVKPSTNSLFHRVTMSGRRRAGSTLSSTLLMDRQLSQGSLSSAMLYASTRVTFHLILRHSRHLSVIPVMLPSPSSLCFTYCSLSSFIVSPSSVLRLFFRYGSIPPLLCSEHHSSDLWLRYLSLTSSHSCG